MDEVGFDFDAVKAKWAERGYLQKNSQGKYHHTRNGAMHIKIKFSQANELEEVYEGNTPFDEK
jgi:hypothetical protein